jgi:dienelactone hydrolase
VPALLLIPKALKGKTPAALCLHQTTFIGKEEPAGLGGLDNLHYAQELAERGWVCLIPDYPTLGEHNVDVYKLGWQSGSMKAIWDNMRGIDLLQGLKEVDSKRIAAIGHSLGGHNSLFTAAFDSRIKCVVTSCGFTSFPKYYGGTLGGWGGPRYMPRIRTQFQTPDKMPFDFDDVLTAIAPNAVFISAPVRDSNFEVSGVDDVVRKVGAYYRELSAGDKLAVIHPNCEHDWPKESREQAYRFMERWTK